MTVDNSAPLETEIADEADSMASARSAARPFLFISLGFLVLSLLLGLIAAIQLVVPDLFSGIGVLVYGKALPMATDAFLFGWLTIGLMGALIHVVTRSGGGVVRSPASMRIVAGLMAVGVIGGSVGIALDMSEGRRYLEYPLWADALLLLGMLGFARGLGQAARSATADAGPVRWYGVAASWWLILAYVVGNIPGLTGLASTYQTSFFRASIMGLWLASAGVAVVYAVIPKLVGRDAFTPTRLTLLGFWSLAFVWAMTAPADLTYSPAPGWLGTVGVVFSLGLLIPGAVIFTDLVLAMRHRWESIRGDVTMRFVMLGAGLFAVWPVVNLMVALRASSTLVQFTDWIGAVEQIALYGAFTAWLIAFVYFAAPELMGKAGRRRLGVTHYLGTVLGLLVWSGASLIAGVATGWTWASVANEADISAAGPGWINTIDTLEVLQPVAFAGMALFVVAQLVFLVNVLLARPAEAGAPAEIEPAEIEPAEIEPAEIEPAEIEPVDVETAMGEEPDPELALDSSLTPARLRLGVVGLFVVAAVLVLVVPALDTGGVEASILADSSRTYDEGTLEAEGRDLYLTEGCWYCHTQQVRAIVTDVGLGAVSVASDYVYESPVLLGAFRVGPDLTHAGSRPNTDDPAWVAAHLVDPRAERSYSTMPAYDHLSDTELEALATYVVGLK